MFGALAGWARLPGGAFPLAAGYVVALLAAGDGRRAGAATVTSLAAMALVADGIRWAEQGLILLLAWLLAWGLKRSETVESIAAVTAGSGCYRQSPLPFLVLGGTLFLRVGMLYVAGVGTEAMMWAAGESLLELGAALLLLPAVSLHRYCPPRLEFPHLVGLVVAWGGLTWVLAPLDLHPFNGSQVLLFVGVLALASGAGVALSAPAAAALGALVAAAGGGLDVIGFSALAGLGAGLGHRWGKAGVAGGLLASQLLLGLFGFRWEQLAPGLVHAVAAAALFALIPKGFIERWLGWAGVADGDAAGESGDFRSPEPEQTLGSKVSAGYLRRLSLVFDELAEAFGETGSALDDAGGQVREGEDAMRLFVEGVSERICEGCAGFAFCWEENTYNAYQGLVELARGAEQNGRLALEDVPPWLREHCIQPGNLLRAAADTFQLVKLHHLWERRLAQSRELVPQQLRGVARLVRELAAELEENGAGPWKRWLSRLEDHPGSHQVGPERVVGSGLVVSHHGQPVWLRVDTAVVERAKDGSVISGDSEDRLDLGAHRVALVLSDGMGAGERAARESRAVVRVLRRLLEAGFDPHFAVRMVNAVLLLRSPEETFATLDLAVIDLRAQEAEFLKVGAPPTIIVRGTKGARPSVEMIRGASVPAGILQQVDVEVQRRPLRPGDLVVMMTDGYLEGLADEGDAEERLLQCLAGVSAAEPPAVVRHLLEQLKGRPLPDDVTLLAARLEAAEPPETEPQYVGEYRRQRG